MNRWGVGRGRTIAKAKGRCKVPEEEDDDERADVEACPHPIFKNMKALRCVRENHMKPVRGVLFNTVDPACPNLLATVGECQASVYDDARQGFLDRKHNATTCLDLMLNFVNEEDGFNPGGELYCLCWLPGDDPVMHREALLAVSGEDTRIHILSMNQCRIIRQLHGHRECVVSLSSHASSGRLVSLSNDHEARLWNWKTGECLGVFHPEGLSCRTVVFHPKGDRFLTAGDEILEWEIDAHLKSLCSKGPGIPTWKKCDARRLKHPHKGRRIIECVQYIHEGSEIVSRADDECICRWDVETGQVTFHIALASMKNPIPSSFDVSLDENYLVVGNGDGLVFIYDLQTGQRLRCLRNAKCKYPIAGCQFSHDSRHVVAIAGPGYIYRWDYLDPAIKLDVIRLLYQNTFLFQSAPPPSSEKRVALAEALEVIFRVARAGVLSHSAGSAHPNNPASAGNVPSNSGLSSLQSRTKAARLIPRSPGLLFFTSSVVPIISVMIVITSRSQMVSRPALSIRKTSCAVMPAVGFSTAQKRQQNWILSCSDPRRICDRLVTNSAKSIAPSFRSSKA
eukprot:TRINITY_DN24566_c0_g1_i1.p1 TRINITY_DN24566_c0_g1~~TRINITY_DN24566_c0_g1_i1.p1  ORF type:complete len:566 (-),score=44.83 TRINITY_DN24566_c0_g1_i1:274-1971(-)